jgi:hypothetical protein
LRADASNGTTGVFINGRRLPILDYVRLANYVHSQLVPGRYWLDASGNFGYEHGPVMGNINIVAMQANGGGAYGGGGQAGQCYGNGACVSGNTNTGGYVATDGQGGAMVHTPDGHVVLTP